MIFSVVDYRTSALGPTRRLSKPWLYLIQQFLLYKQKKKEKNLNKMIKKCAAEKKKIEIQCANWPFYACALVISLTQKLHPWLSISWPTLPTSNSYLFLIFSSFLRLCPSPYHPLLSFSLYWKSLHFKGKNSYIPCTFLFILLPLDICRFLLFLIYFILVIVAPCNLMIVKVILRWFFEKWFFLFTL